MIATSSAKASILSHISGSIFVSLLTPSGGVRTRMTFTSLVASVCVDLLLIVWKGVCAGCSREGHQQWEHAKFVHRKSTGLSLRL